MCPIQTVCYWDVCKEEYDEGQRNWLSHMMKSEVERALALMYICLSYDIFGSVYCYGFQ